MADKDQQLIIEGIQKYPEALEQNRQIQEKVKILTLPTSRTIRHQIVSMVTHIQKEEYLLPVTEEINACILRAEEDFYFKKSCNFWHAVDQQGMVIGSIGLRQLDSKTTEIKKFFVRRDFRGKGVAQKLMQTAFKAASRHDFNEIYLGTVPVLKEAHRFYENMVLIVLKKCSYPLFLRFVQSIQFSLKPK